MILVTAEIRAKRKSVCDGRTREGLAGRTLLSLQVSGLQEKQLIYCTVSKRCLAFKTEHPTELSLSFQKAVFDEMERFH